MGFFEFGGGASEVQFMFGTLYNDFPIVEINVSTTSYNSIYIGIICAPRWGIHFYFK